MEHVIVRYERSEEVLVSISNLQERLARLTDTRQQQGKTFPVPHLYSVISLPKLSGQHTPKDIGEWIRLPGLQLLKARAAGAITEHGSGTLASSVLAAKLHLAYRQYLHEEDGG